MNKEFLKFLESKKLTQEQFEALDMNVVADTFNEYHTAEKAAIDAAIESKASKDDIADMTKSLHEKQEANHNSMLAIVTKHGAALTKITSTEAKYVGLSFKDQIVKGLEDNQDNLNKLKDGNASGAFKFDIKAAAEMTFPNNIDPNEIPQAQRLAGFNPLARRQPFIQSIVSNGSATSNVISWVEYINPDGGPAFTAEATTKNISDFDFQVSQEIIKKFTVFSKISDEMQSDIPFMTSTVTGDLRTRLSLTVDNEILNGTSGASSLNGIRTQATAFSAGSFADTVDNANLIDVLVVAMDNIAVANHVPNVIVLHPSDLTALELIKVSVDDQRYVSKLSEIADRRSLSGVPIITNTGMPIGNYLVMDSSKVTVWTKQDMTVDVGLDSDDFIRNMITIRAEWRGAVVVQLNDKTAIVGGVITTDIEALDPLLP